ncbi:hypothetical protein D3C71_2021740 [compost metagenome]
MCLGAIFDYLDIMKCCQLHDRIHITRPAGQMHTDNTPGTRGQDGLDRLCGNVLGIAVDLSEDRNRTGIDNAGN